MAARTRAPLALLVPLVLALLPTSAAGNPCANLTSCANATTSPGCGWCWRSSTTVDQITGPRPGNSSGPTDGSPCSDWTFSHSDCQHHVDCPGLPDCANILGTYCGFCTATSSAMRGTAQGPDPPATCAHGWITDPSACPHNPAPQHVHLMLGPQSDTYMVVWATSVSGESSASLWTSPNSTRGAVSASSYKYGVPFNTHGIPYYHFAIFDQLKPDTTYFYAVETNAISSPTFNFTTPPPSGETRLVVYGDMGRHGGGEILYHLVNEMHSMPLDSRYHAIIHVGDFAYNLEDNGGLNGDTFMARIQALAAFFPYISCPGNHEIEAATFSQYRNRFPLKHLDNSGHGLWYSFNLPNVHFVSYSTEVYFANVWEVEAQLAWLKADLAAANKDRAAHPWIVAFGHRPMMCSNSDGDDCTRNSSVVRASLEPLFQAAGVDLVIEAHEHSYERLWPTVNEKVVQFNYTNPRAPVHVITGAAGCNENDGACINPIPGPRLPWSAFRSSAQGTYSFTRLFVKSADTLCMESFLVEANTVEDSFCITQTQHGPFPTQI